LIVVNSDCLTGKLWIFDSCFWLLLLLQFVVVVVVVVVVVFAIKIVMVSKEVKTVEIALQNLAPYFAGAVYTERIIIEKLRAVIQTRFETFYLSSLSSTIISHSFLWPIPCYRGFSLPA